MVGQLSEGREEVIEDADPREQEAEKTPASSPRLALVSTPRSGNTWLRYLLSEIYAIPGLSAHRPTEVDWEALPGGCLLQIHWHRTEAFLARLAKHRFQVVTIARHPLDVLISHLHHALHTLEDRALDGEGGDERSLVGAMPRSLPFLHYATGTRAAALLSVTSEWWREAKVHQLRYESLVADAPGQLRTLVDGLDAEVRRPIAEVVAEMTMKELRVRTGNERHFWMGRPGLWRCLLTAAEARSIGAAHADVFARLGYDCNADPNLQAAQADAHWVELCRVERADEIRKFAEGRQALANMAGQIQMTEAQLDAVRLERDKAVERWEARPRGLVGLVRYAWWKFRSQLRRLSDHFAGLAPLSGRPIQDAT